MITKIDSFQQLSVKLDATDIIARKADDKSDSAHKRINGLTTVMMWAIGIGATATAITIALLSFLWNVIS